MITKQYLELVKQKLNLEKITSITKVILFCTPKNKKDIEKQDFIDTVDIIKKEISNEGIICEIQIIEEGELDNEPPKLCDQSSANGFNECRK